MGCCTSSPHARRIYRDPADLDEIYVSSEADLQELLDDPRVLPLRRFGKYRNNGVVVPDDIDGLPSSRLMDKLRTPPDTLLYEAELDHAYAWRCLRPVWTIYAVFPPLWPAALACLQAGMCSCDEVCCWVRKEYASRKYYRIYPNRIEINKPHVRVPFGYLGCGSWNGDSVLAHPFDRGAFGFRRVNTCAPESFWGLPVWGDVVARQRCQCNGPPWGTSGGGERGWWCDEWCCDVFFCSYRYTGLADGDEVAAASNLALQAYFEGRSMSRHEMERLLEYWRQNISEESSPVERKRPVLCEDKCCVPTLCTGAGCYSKIYQRERTIPAQFAEPTSELREVYANYERLRQRQIQRYNKFTAPQRLSTVCKNFGCQRCCGRRGFCFCTEGCNSQHPVGCCYQHIPTNHKKDDPDPFPPFIYPDYDDDNDAAKILHIVLGPPPINVEYRRWVYDETAQEFRVQVVRGSAPPPPKTVVGSESHTGLATQVFSEPPPEQEITTVNDPTRAVTIEMTIQETAQTEFGKESFS